MDGGSSPLDSALMSGDPDRQVGALIELIKLGDGAAVADILPLVGSRDVAVRSEAVRAIGYLGVALVPVVGPVLVRIAAYRSGDRSQLEGITRDAARMEEDESARFLNDLEDLLRPPVPPTLPEDSTLITTILDLVAMRWPLYSRQARHIRDQLPTA
ncbi:hypothetical protein [Nocardia sp. NBC_01009]|uniref:hypothetical protein n=1 Tax=Nocardia sp. NBC_01009 TaxID=2975996 RepID=UPI0038661789|nr:hypothetical protein OHA42_10255 [Nocardia sp. NBC_01009]